MENDIAVNRLQMMQDELRQFRKLNSVDPIKLGAFSKKARGNIEEIFGIESPVLILFDAISSQSLSVANGTNKSLSIEYCINQYDSLLGELGDELQGYGIFGLGMLALPFLKNTVNKISSTGTMIDSTILALNASMQQIQDEAIARLEPGLDSKLSESLSPIKVELDSLKDELKPLGNSLKQVEDFIQKNVVMLTNSIEFSGRLKSLESQIPSIMARLERIETDKDKTWNRRATIIGIILTILGIVVGYYVGLHK